MIEKLNDIKFVIDDRAKNGKETEYIVVNRQTFEELKNKFPNRNSKDFRVFGVKLVIEDEIVNLSYIWGDYDRKVR